ncbi:MAG: tetratricopeptide repeat protein [Bacteroidota bacterium]|nr:tetratricopeptide repeat protein [Bacteroidota bacterium]
MLFRKQIQTILLLSILLATQVLAAQENSAINLLKEANTHYKNNEFIEAEKVYLQLMNSGISSPELYYNLGNTYYRLQKNTEAIYYYEKALIIAPDDKDIIHNLKHAKLSITERLEEVPKFFLLTFTNKIINSQTADSWALYSLFGFLLMLASILIYLFNKRRKYKVLGFTMAILLLVTTTASFIFSQNRLKTETDNPFGIIFTEAVALRSSPDETATVLIRVSAGHKVKVSEYSGNWAEIKLSNGQVGWVLKTDVRML